MHSDQLTYGPYAWYYLQAYQADVMIAEMFTPCSALLAHTLDLPWINQWPVSPVEPFSTSQWAGSNRRLFQPNPLSYFPQFRIRGTGPTTQHLVGSLSWRSAFIGIPHLS